MKLKGTDKFFDEKTSLLLESKKLIKFERDDLLKIFDATGLYLSAMYVSYSIYLKNKTRFAFSNDLVEDLFNNRTVKPFLAEALFLKTSNTIQKIKYFNIANRQM